jgi:4a-hydroxytetrahydrobiopterin dehydratase
MYLHEQHCLKNTTPQIIDNEKLNKHLEEIPLWKTSIETNSISRKFKFKDYHQTLLFINAVSAIAEQENHHPEITFGYNHCTIDYSTHSAGGITLFDLICAAHIEQLMTKKTFKL